MIFKCLLFNCTKSTVSSVAIPQEKRTSPTLSLLICNAKQLSVICYSWMQSQVSGYCHTHLVVILERDHKTFGPPDSIGSAYSYILPPPCAEMSFTTDSTIFLLKPNVGLKERRIIAMLLSLSRCVWEILP